MVKKFAIKTFKFLSSLKLAVFTIGLLATVSAVGTFYESIYDTETAQTLIYKSVYMKVALILFAINITCSALDRYPWKIEKHLGFLVAHLGILMVLAGALITQKLGIDGSLALKVGSQDRWVSVTEKELTLYATQDGSSFVTLFYQPVEFLKNPPSEKNPLVIKTPDGEVMIKDFYPYALSSNEMKDSENMLDGPAIRFQLSNTKANVTQWMRARANQAEVFSMGPAQVVLTQSEYKPSGENEIVLTPQKKSDTLSYKIYTKSRPQEVKKGFIKVGEMVETGWMGLEFRLLKLMSHAKEETIVKPLEKPTPMTTSAIKVSFQGAEHWMEMNSLLKMFSKDVGYVLSYGNHRLDLGFPMTLKEFKMTKYPGSQRAASYSSVVEVSGKSAATISMNEPLKEKGYTFYQASFETDPATGQPVRSILSVNYDPGRIWKYLGSLMIVLGSIILFYFKRKLARLQKPKES